MWPDAHWIFAKVCPAHGRLAALPPPAGLDAMAARAAATLEAASSEIWNDTSLAQTLHATSLLDKRDALAFMSEEWFKKGLVDDEGQGLCVVTAVDGAFEDFVPAFVSSLYWSHPHSLAIVLSPKPLLSHIREVLATSGVPLQSYSLIVDHRLESVTGNTAHSGRKMAAHQRWPLRASWASNRSRATAVAGYTPRM